MQRNEIPRRHVNPKNSILMRILSLLLICTAVISCGKSNNSSGSGDETVLYGTWIKGTNAGDTLQFYKKNDKNMMTYNASFNASLPAYDEVEYAIIDGKLSIKNYLGRDGFFPIQSFSWKQYGKEFDIQGSELYLIMSSTLVHFTYRKIQ